VVEKNLKFNNQGRIYGGDMGDISPKLKKSPLKSAFSLTENKVGKRRKNEKKKKNMKEKKVEKKKNGKKES